MNVPKIGQARAKKRKDVRSFCSLFDKDVEDILEEYSNEVVACIIKKKNHLLLQSFVMA